LIHRSYNSNQKEKEKLLELELWIEDRGDANSSSKGPNINLPEVSSIKLTPKIRLHREREPDP
jgi:hypothetical protein